METEPVSSLHRHLHAVNTAAPAATTAVERLRSRLWQHTRRELGAVSFSARHAESSLTPSTADRELLARCVLYHYASHEEGEILAARGHCVAKAGEVIALAEPTAPRAEP